VTPKLGPVGENALFVGRPRQGKKKGYKGDTYKDLLAVRDEVKEEKRSYVGSKESYSFEKKEARGDHSMGDRET